MNFFISPKPFAEFTPDEYHAYISDMFVMPRKKVSAKASAGVVGLTLNRTKKGTLSLRRSKARTFEYVTMSEIKKFADFVKVSQAEVWNLFKKKEYIIANTKMECEKIYSKSKGVLWDRES